jgi:MSHA biogenesis protein MshM
MRGAANLENQCSFDLSELRDNPFGRAVGTSYPYLGLSFREALAALYYGLEYGTRILLLTADRGLGKSTLLHYFEGRIRNRGRTLLMCPSPDKSSELLRDLLTRIGGTAASGDLFEIRKQVDETVIKVADAERPFILLLDYDDNAVESALESLGQLTSLISFEKGLLRVVIAGSSDLAEKCQSAKFADEIRRVPLSRLTHAEVEGYIDYRLRIVGWRGGRLFTSGACNLIAEKSSASPAAINEICSVILRNLGEVDTNQSVSAPRNHSIVDESYVDLVVTGRRLSEPPPAHSLNRRIAAGIIFVLVLAMAGLWYRSATKARAPKPAAAEINAPDLSRPYAEALYALRPEPSPSRAHFMTANSAAGNRIASTSTSRQALESAGGRETGRSPRVSTAAVTTGGDSPTGATDQMAAYEIKLGDAYMNVGDYDRALASFARAVALAPENKEAQEKVQRARRAKTAEDTVLK